jgi:hypothetical protein
MAAVDQGDEPPIRLVLAALFTAARIVAAPLGASRDEEATREQLVRGAVADADELIRQVST